MTLFCDLDGVLADFNHGVLELTGKLPDDQFVGSMWKAVSNADRFFYNLEWMSDGQLLWSNIMHHNPSILTGIPYGGWAAQQKRDWCAERLDAQVEVIPCWSRDKHTFAVEGDILIDDRLKAKDPWESVGGIFIHHTSTESTLDDLEFVLR